MKFTEKEEELLKNIYKNKQDVLIKGINNYGEKFEVKNKISTAVNKQAEICHDGICLQFENRDDYSPVYTTPFCTELDLSQDGFMILEIFDEKGKCIYKNQDSQEIIKKTTKNGMSDNLKKVIEGENIIFLDPVSKILKTMIGKPIIVTNYYKDINGNEDSINDKGVLIRLDKTIHGFLADLDERIYIDCGIAIVYCQDLKIHCTAIGKKSVLKTIIDGKIVELADNRNFSLEDIWEKRKNSFKKAKSENKMAREVKELKDKIMEDVIKRDQQEKEQQEIMKEENDWWEK